MDDLPEPLLRAIAASIGTFDGSFRRRCDAAADAARLALVGNAACTLMARVVWAVVGNAACTLMARVVWALVDPGCEEACAQAAEEARRASENVVAPPRLPDAVGPTSSAAALRAAAEQLGSRRRTGSRAQIWDGIQRRLVILESTRVARQTIEDEVRRRAAAQRFCWVRTAARRQMQEEARRVMDAVALSQVYDVRGERANDIPSVQVQRGARLGRTTMLWRVTDVIRALARQHGSAENACRQIRAQREAREARRDEANALMHRLPDPIRDLSPFWGMYWSYVNHGSSDSLATLQTATDRASEHLRDVDRELRDRDVVGTPLRWPPLYQLVFFHQGSAASVAERWSEIAFLHEHTEMRVPTWYTADLLRDRPIDVWTHLTRWCARSAALPGPGPARPVPARFATFVRNARAWTAVDPEVDPRAILFTDLLGGPHTRLGRSGSAFFRENGAQAASIESARAAVVAWFGERAWLDVRERMDAWQVAALSTKSPHWAASVILEAVCDHRVARVLPTLHGSRVVPRQAFEVLRRAWSASVETPITHSLANLDRAARKVRSASSRRRWHALVRTTDWLARLHEPTIACPACRRTFVTDAALRAHVQRAHGVQD